MSHRLSQLLGGLQSKLDAAIQSHGTHNSYGQHANGAQAPYGAPNSYNPPAPYGPPPQGAPGQYGHPLGHAPPAPYAPPGHPPAYGTPYPNESPFPQAPPTPHDPPSHSGPSGAHDSFDVNMNPDTLEPYPPPPGPPPHSSSSNHCGASYGQPQHHAAPSFYGPPPHEPNQYPPPPQTGSPNPPYGHPSQNPPPGPYGHNGGPPAPYGAPNSYPPQGQAPSAPSGPSTFPSRIAIRSGGLTGGSTTIHDSSNPNAPPLYNFRTSKSKPQVVMLHPDGRTEVGQASISSMTMNMELSLRGRSMPMKQNETGDTFTIQSPRGRFKWSIDQMKGCLGKMKDEQGTVVARYKGGDLPGVGERGVEICVPCDQELFELVVLSMMAGRALNKKNVKVGMKFLEHALGA